MGTMFQVTNEDIKKLNQSQLAELLLMLINLEVTKFSIPQNCIGGSLNIYHSDDGEDAHVKWESGVSNTDWLPNRYTMFQCKAKDMDPSDCKKEILTKTKKLKNRVEDVLDHGGSYILFYNKDCTTSAKKRRINAFREAINNAGKTYTDTADISIYDASDIARWVNNFFPAIQMVLNNLGKYITAGFLTWKQWSGYQEFREFGYIKDSYLDLNIQKIRTHFSEPKKVARIVGLSGLGKTRLAFEIFKPSDQFESGAFLSDQLVYCDASDFSNLPAIFKQLRSQKLRGIVVVDDCNYELHNELTEEVKHSESELSLLTLDFEVEPSNIADPLIKLEPSSDEVIEGILRQAYSNIKDSDISRISSFAQGFPLLAVLLARARLSEENDIGSLKDNDIARKLLWGRESRDPKHQEVISVCSLFDHLGFEGGAESQRIYVAKKICANSISPDDFYSIVKGFMKRGIIDVRNRYIRVIPLPLAIRLAADWWMKCSPEKAKKILTEDDIPEGLLDALCRRLSMLHFVKEAQELTKGFCEETGPFGQAEVLNSSKGSLLFRSLVEVNPSATAIALERVFGGWSNEQLREIGGTVRRNLVESLVKLCFWEVSFLYAARVMLAFAAAENETWANNATNQFLQLFHLLLSGTQAAPELRLQVIDEALGSTSDEKKVVAIRGLGHALMGSHFSRMGGVETQGSRPAQDDWRPKNYSEIFSYWRSCLNRLIPIACETNEFGQLAREQFANGIRTLIQYGLMDEIESSLDKIQSKWSQFWAYGFKKIQEAIVHEGSKIPKEGLDRLQRWEDILMPKTMTDRLFIFISEPAWGQYTKNEEGNYIDLAAQKARDMAVECVKDIPRFYDSLDVLFRGEQRQGDAFGYRLGEIIKEPALFLVRVLDVMKNIPSEKLNTTVLGSYLAAIQQKDYKLFDKTIDLLISDNQLCEHTASILRSCRPSIDRLGQILDLVRLQKLDIKDLKSFEYGRSLDHLNHEEISNFCSQLAEISSEGFIIAFGILYMYCLNSKDRQSLCRNMFRQFVMDPEIFTKLRQGDQMDYFHIEGVMKYLLKDYEDNELAESAITTIIKECSSSDYIYDHNFEHVVPGIIKILLSKYIHITWPIIGKSLISEDEVKKYRLISVLTWHNKINDNDEWPFKDVTDHFIMDWCELNPESAPQIIAEIYPMVTMDEHEFNWNSLAEFLFSKFGNDTRMLEIISINLQPRLTWGSGIPYTRKKIKLMEKMKNHKSPVVRQWANECISYWSKEIEYDEKREQERSIGVF